MADHLRTTVHRAGIRDDFQLEPMLSVNSGVALHSVFQHGPEKGRKVFLPKADWNAPSTEHLSVLMDNSTLRNYSHGVFVFRLDDVVVEQFWNDLDIDALAQSPTTATASSARAIQPVLSNLQSGLFSNQARNCSVTLVVNKGGLDTTTFSSVAGGFVGLHFDKLQSDSLSQRRNFDLRLGVNLGAETRHVTFSSVPVSGMGELLGLDEARLCSIYDKERHELVAMYFDRFPDLPLVRVALPPGFGWAMVTQNVVHDGSSAGMKSMDVNAIVRLSSEWIHPVRSHRHVFSVPAGGVELG